MDNCTCKRVNNCRTLLSIAIHRIKVALLFLIIGLYCTGTAQELPEGNRLLAQMIQTQTTEPVTAIKLGFRILEIPVGEVHDTVRAYAVNLIGGILDRQGLQAQSLRFYLQALEMLTAAGVRERGGYLLIDIGNTYYRTKAYDLAAEKYQAAREVFTSRGDLGGIYTSVNNLGLIQREQNRFETAKALFFEGLSIARRLPDIPFLRAHSYGYLGDLYKKMGFQDSAIVYYDSAMTIKITQKGNNLIGLNQLKVAEILLDRGDLNGAEKHLKLAEADFLADFNIYNILKVYQQLSGLYQQLLDEAKAVSYLKSALLIAERGDIVAEQITILSKLVEIYRKNGNVNLVNENLQKVSELQERLYREDVDAVINKLDVQHLIDEYFQELKVKEMEVDRANLERNGLFVFSGLSLLVIWLFWKKYRLKKQYFEQLMATKEEQHNRELEINRLKEEMSQRELMMMATNLQTQNDLLNDLKKQLLDSKKAEGSVNPGTVRKVVSSIDEILDKDASWKQFEEQFVKIHPGFFKKLIDNCPSISATELKLCAYHKMNLETKEIASITSLSVRSIQTFRYRLRKKLQIPAESTFQAFINSL